MVKILAKEKSLFAGNRGGHAVAEEGGDIYIVGTLLAQGDLRKLEAAGITLDGSGVAIKIKAKLLEQALENRLAKAE